MLLSPTSAQQLGVLAFLADDFDKVLAESDAARIAVGKNLRRRGVVVVDLAVDAEHRHAGVFGLANVGDRAVGIGRIEQNAPVALRDDVFEMRRFLVRVVLRIEHRGVVTQLLDALLCRSPPSTTNHGLFSVEMTMAIVFFAGVARSVTRREGTQHSRSREDQPPIGGRISDTSHNFR